MYFLKVSYTALFLLYNVFVIMFLLIEGYTSNMCKYVLTS